MPRSTVKHAINVDVDSSYTYLGQHPAALFITPFIILKYMLPFICYPLVYYLKAFVKPWVVNTLKWVVDTLGWQQATNVKPYQVIGI